MPFLCSNLQVNGKPLVFLVSFTRVPHPMKIFPLVNCLFPTSCSIFFIVYSNIIKINSFKSIYKLIRVIDEN